MYHNASKLFFIAMLVLIVPAGIYALCIGVGFGFNLVIDDRLESCHISDDKVKMFLICPLLGALINIIPATILYLFILFGCYVRYKCMTPRIIHVTIAPISALPV